MPLPQPYALELRNITKRYPLVLANDHISLDVKWGEVLGLVGENGAGKSTLMKIVYGIVQPDIGEIAVNGSPLVIKTPSDAIEHGIGMVHQHFMLVDPLTVLENVILGSEPGTAYRLDLKQARQQIQALIAELGFDLDPNARIEDLPVGLRQRVEILKAIYRRARILILDEPTAVLTPQECTELFSFLRRFVNNGGAVIFISHKLGEVMQVADRISVIRDGKVVGTVETPQTTPAQLARLMVGREVVLTVGKSEQEAGEVRLQVDDLWVDDAGKKGVVQEVTFQVRSREIVGIAGIEGNGQTQLIEAIAGLRPYRGQIGYGSRRVPSTAKQVRQAGVCHIPEDRNARGLVLDFPTRDNAILGDQGQPTFISWLGFFKEAAIDQHAQDIVENFDVRPRGIQLATRRYSGGNAQKIIVGRELTRHPQILIAAHPTRGVDIGAIEFIHQQIIAARDQGMAVLLVSADLNEVISLSDRILVLQGGRIRGEIIPASGSTSVEEQLGLLMGGVAG